MNDVRELERGITAAHERGDAATLQRLQAEYRSSALATRVSGPDSIVMHERSQTVATASAPTVAEGDTVLTVVVRPEARHGILNAPLSTSWECGGFLVGHEDGDKLVIETVYAADGSDYTGERHTLRLDAEWMAVLDERAQRGGWKIVGDWHTHPESDTRPSGNDGHGWLGQAAGLKQNYVGIIIEPHPHDETDPFARPQWRGYLATKAGSLQRIALSFELD